MYRRCCRFNILIILALLNVNIYSVIGKDAIVQSKLYREKKSPEFEKVLQQMRSLLHEPRDEEHDELENVTDKTHTGTISVQLDPELDFKAVKVIAKDAGFDHVSQVGIGQGLYRFSHVQKREQILKEAREKLPEATDDGVNNIEKITSKRDRIESLLNHEKVRWLKREKILEREKRVPVNLDNGNDVRVFSEKFNDPQIKNEWYIKNDGQTSGPANFDSGISPVWDMGISGKGVVISILDDGIDHTHPELKDNYDPEASIDLNGKDDDPFPNDSDPYNAHGTKCAGTIASKANNNLCGVGIAYDAKVGGIRMLDGKATDGLEADALSYHRNHINIYSCSWGPKDNGQTFGRPGPLGRVALAQGAKFGRNGLGSLFVWATGNGGMMTDDCNADGYVNSIYTIGIGSVNEHGVSTYYGEQCPSQMAVTYCSGKHSSTDFSNSNANVITTYLHHKCTNHFVGTSSAAPLAAAIFALVLEANPKLTWRDVQHLVFQTAKKTSPYDLGWRVNGCGKPYNHKFGFGVLNAESLVTLAKNWTTVPKQKSCHFHLNFKNGDIPSRHHFKLNFTTDGCQKCSNKSENGTCKNAITKLEHVVVNITLKHRRRGDLSIDLISPSGTISHMLHKRPYDGSTAGLKGWTFMTLFNWCENPKGTWQLVFTDNDIGYSHERDVRDMEEVYIKELDKEKQGRESTAKGIMEDTEDASVTVNAEKQVYDRAEKREEDDTDNSGHDYPSKREYQHNHDKGLFNGKSRYNDNRYYNKRSRDYDEIHDKYYNRYRRSRRGISTSQDVDADDNEDKTDFILYKRRNEKFTVKYEDEKLQNSLLAGLVQYISVTFYGY